MVEVPTSSTIFPAVDVAPAALPERMVSPPELVVPADWLAVRTVSAVLAVVAPASIISVDDAPDVNQVDAATPVRFKAPALVTATVPEVVVDKVRGPEVVLTVKPPVAGPVTVRAVVPEKVKPPPKVVKPEPLKLKVGLVVTLPKTKDVALVFPTLIAAAPEVSKVRAEVPPDLIVKAPESTILLVVKVCEPRTEPVIKVPTPALVSLVVEPKTISPKVLTVNLVAPDADAVNISFTPCLLTIRAA